MPHRTVYVVDDDRDVRRSISFMLGASDIRAHPFGSGADFLDSIPDLKPGCVLLDIRMPEMDGFQVMEALATREVDWPVVVMTGHGEVAVAVRAMKQGAVDFIEKPFTEDTLLTSFNGAFRMLEERAGDAERRRTALTKVGGLTTRESEVLQALMGGLSNKAIALELGIALRTVEMHRSNMMDKLGVASLAEALTIALDAGLSARGR